MQKKSSKVTGSSKSEEKTSSSEGLRINQELYKRNAELAFRNKTLALLEKLYQITLDTLDLRVLGRQMATTIREALQLELASIYTLDSDQSALEPLSYAIGATTDYIPRSISVSDTADPRIRALLTNTLLRFDDPAQVWDQSALQKISVSIATVLIFPLVTENRELGVLVLALNRKLDELPQYEQEILNNLQNVVSVAIDKILLYKALKTANHELQHATLELRVANEELKRLDEAKSEFLSIASHQLLTPLTPIEGFASMLEDGDYGKITSEQKEVARKIKVSAVRLVRLVDDLLNISRIESGRVNYEYAEMSIEDIVEPLVEELQIKAKEKKVKLHFVKPKVKSPAVHIDEEKMRNVFMNLIDNSLKYAAGTESTVSIEPGKGKVLFAVRDKGMGIPKEDISHLFKKFFRGTGAMTVHTEGTGLGLYVAKRYVEAMRGKIWVESGGKGKGAEFYVELLVA